MTPELATTILYSLFFFFLGVAAVLAIGQRFWGRFQAKINADREQALEASRREAEASRSELMVEAKEQAMQIRNQAEREANQIRQQQLQAEQKLDRREEKLTAREETLSKAQRGLESTQTRLAAQMRGLTERRAEAGELIAKQQVALERASGLSRQAARAELLASVEQELESEIGARLIKCQKEVEAKVKSLSRDILLTAMQRYASVQTAEATTSTVGVPTDDMKGRIIGREGRNIRAFEKATGIDLIIDDTPGVVVVSGFDPVRREVARRSLDKLILDGRIHPSKIEEVVDETRSEIEEFIIQAGREAVEEVGLTDVHQRIVEMLGKLHFRTSYSQNVLRHSIEVAFIAGMIAEMIGMDGKLAQRAGLLHDIGKAADHELEGGHPKIGGDLLKRHGECEEVVHAALGHHDEILTEYPYTVLVATADACSASRPGARRESLERYVKRMEELEEIAGRFEGVQQAFAISAGRELRVLVNSSRTTDEQAATICRGIAKAFESELTYPGEIKITVLRESRFTEVAK
ncbi:MAG: ribonuclease Y [Planctomycetota bacterium]